VSKFEVLETQLSFQTVLSETKLPEKLTWSDKMTILSTFLESSLNFVLYNLKKHYKM